MSTATLDEVEMMIEFISEKTTHSNVGIYEVANVILSIGDTYCGLAVFDNKKKIFNFYVTETFNAVLPGDSEVYEEVTLPKFIQRMCR